MAENWRNSYIQKCCSSISSSDWIQKCQLLALLMNSMIARSLSQKTSYKIRSVFLRCDQEPLGMQHTLCVFQESFKEKKVGQRGKKNLKKERRRRQGWKPSTKSGSQYRWKFPLRRTVYCTGAVPALWLSGACLVNDLQWWKCFEP